MGAPAARRGTPPLRRALLLAAAVVVAGAAVGLAPPVDAQRRAGFKKAPPNTDLRVFASAQVKSPFTSAVINLGVGSKRPTLAATISASRFAMATIRRQVTGALIPARDIITRDVSLRPTFNYSANPTTIVGWTINQEVRITTERVGRVQALLRAIASTVGQNVELRISSQRQVGSTEDLVLRALREATLAARSKANRIAKATGKKVKRVIYLGGNKGGWPRQYASNGVYTVACQVNGKFLLVSPGRAVANGSAEGRLEDIVRVAGQGREEAAMVAIAARPDAHMEESGATDGEAAELYGSNPADKEFDSVVTLGSMEEALEGVF